ncbi:group I intron-associated PD-(D/E)XK endonuclease [Nocardioides sp.]|uniref:group I intron-associated PD-(D/E)XK endonuclease n=1 Tax=Nocardioides sp. TaxID=35761 RepID=UPI0039C9BD2E
MAAAWLALSGFQVSWPLEPARYDLVASRCGSLARIQVKTCRRWQGGGWMVSLSTRVSAPGPSSGSPSATRCPPRRTPRPGSS